jgi:hypothetical protein
VFFKNRTDLSSFKPSTEEFSKQNFFNNFREGKIRKFDFSPFPKKREKENIFVGLRDENKWP